MPAISLSTTDCGSDIVLCESMRPQPVTMSGLALQTVPSFSGLLVARLQPGVLGVRGQPGLSVGTPM